MDYIINIIKKIEPKFGDRNELYDVFCIMCDSILKRDLSNMDIFYEMLTENDNNRLYHEYSSV